MDVEVEGYGTSTPYGRALEATAIGRKGQPLTRLMRRPNSFAETTVLAEKVTKPIVALNEFYSFVPFRPIVRLGRGGSTGPARAAKWFPRAFRGLKF